MNDGYDSHILSRGLLKCNDGFAGEQTPDLGQKKEPRESGSVVGSKRKLAVDVAVDHIVGDGFVRVDINLDVG